jgi:threonine aldolase
VIFGVPDAAELLAHVSDRVELTAVSERSIRAVTHMDVGEPDIDTAVSAIADALS